MLTYIPRITNALHTSFISSETGTELTELRSAFFIGEEPAASVDGFAALDRRRESSGDDGVDAPSSADRDVPGVRVADTND